MYGNMLKYTITAHLSREPFYEEQRKWAVIHSSGAVSTLQVSQSAYLYHPYIWITKLVCAPSIQSTVSLSGSLPFVYHPLPLLTVPPPPLSHAATLPGFSRHFVFHCLPFGEVTHDTRWSLATAGGLLIEEKQSGKHGEARAAQCRQVETGGETKGSGNERLSSKEIKWKGVWERQTEQSAMEI